MKTNKMFLGAFSLLLLVPLVSIVPTAEAVIQTVTEDFEDDTPGLAPSSPLYSFRQTLGSAQVEAGKNWRTSIPAYPHERDVFTWAKDPCSLGAGETFKFDMSFDEWSTNVGHPAMNMVGQVYNDYPQDAQGEWDGIRFNVQNNLGTAQMRIMLSRDDGGGGGAAMVWIPYPQGGPGMHTYEFTDINCPAGSITFNVDGAAPITVTIGGGGWPNLNYMTFGHESAASGTTKYGTFRLDNIAMDGIDLPITGDAINLFPAQIDSVQSAYDDSTVFARSRTGTVYKLAADGEIITQANVCSPAFTGIAESADDSSLVNLEVTQDQTLLTTCNITGPTPATLVLNLDYNFNILNSAIVQTPIGKAKIVSTAGDRYSILDAVVQDINTYTRAHSDGFANFDWPVNGADFVSLWGDKSTAADRRHWAISETGGLIGLNLDGSAPFIGAHQGRAVASFGSTVYIQLNGGELSKNGFTGTAMLWDSDVSGVTVGTDALFYSRDGAYLVAWNGNNVWVIDTATNAITYDLTTGGNVNRCSIDTANNYVYCSTDAGNNPIEKFAVFDGTTSLAGDGGAGTPNPLPDTAPLTTGSGTTSGGGGGVGTGGSTVGTSGGQVTAGQGGFIIVEEEGFVAKQAKMLSDNWGVSIDGAKWLLGLVIIIFVAALVASKFSGAAAAIMAVIGTLGGLGLAVALGVIPVWFLITIVLVIVIMVSRALTPAKGE